MKKNLKEDAHRPLRQAPRCQTKLEVMFASSQKHTLHLVGASTDPELNTQYTTTKPEYSDSIQILLNDLGES